MGGETDIRINEAELGRAVDGLLCDAPRSGKAAVVLGAGTSARRSGGRAEQFQAHARRRIRRGLEGVRRDCEEPTAHLSSISALLADAFVTGA